MRNSRHQCLHKPAVNKLSVYVYHEQLMFLPQLYLILSNNDIYFTGIHFSQNGLFLVHAFWFTLVTPKTFAIFYSFRKLLSLKNNYTNV